MLLRIAALVVLMPLVLSGCSSERESSVERVTEQFHMSLRDSDGQAACALLSDDAQQEVAQSQGSTCGAEIVQSGLPDSGRPRSAEVFGTAAQVRYDDDVVFLARYGDGWRVIAAGCAAVTDAPYDCAVQAG